MPARIVCSPMGTVTGWQPFAQPTGRRRAPRSPPRWRIPRARRARWPRPVALVAGRRERGSTAAEAYAAYQRRGEPAGRRPRGLPRRGTPDRRSGRGGDGVDRPGAPSVRGGRLRPSSAARDRGGEAAADPGVAERHAREALDVAQRCPTRTSSAWRSRSSVAPSSGKVASPRARPARRGDDSCPRRRVERSARMRRRLLHDARRLRQPRRPPAGRRMVRGGRRVHDRRHFIPVQSWCRGIFGGVLVRAGEWERAEEVLPERSSGSPNREAGGRALPLAVLAELRLRQGRIGGRDLLDGLDQERVAVGPLVRLALERGEPGSRGRISSAGPKPRQTTASDRRSGEAWHWRAATSTVRMPPRRCTMSATPGARRRPGRCRVPGRAARGRPGADTAAAVRELDADVRTPAGGPTRSRACPVRLARLGPRPVRRWRSSPRAPRTPRRGARCPARRQPGRGAAARNRRQRQRDDARRARRAHDARARGAQAGHGRALER